MSYKPYKFCAQNGAARARNLAPPSILQIAIIHTVRSPSYECQKSHHQGSKCSSFILTSQTSPIAGHPCRKPISSSQSAPTRWCWVESASDTMGGEGNCEIVLEDYKVELENGGEAWEGMGYIVLERWVLVPVFALRRFDAYILCTNYILATIGISVGGEERVRGSLKYKWRTGHSTPSPAALRRKLWFLQWVNLPSNIEALFFTVFH